MSVTARLDHVQLHGAVVHLVIRDNKLFAATERGDHEVLDLASFNMAYCDLLRSVWRKAPVVWEGGLPVLRSIPTSHKCAH